MDVSKQKGYEKYPEKLADFGFTTPDIIDLNKENRDIYIDGFKDGIEWTMNHKDKQLIIQWFKSIMQIATDRKNANGFVMKDSDALLNIKIHAKDAIEYLQID